MRKRNRSVSCLIGKDVERHRKEKGREEREKEEKKRERDEGELRESVRGWKEWEAHRKKITSIESKREKREWDSILSFLQHNTQTTHTISSLSSLSSLSLFSFQDHLDLSFLPHSAERFFSSLPHFPSPSPSLFISHLTLESCGLSSLPPSLFSLSRLRSLVLRRNAISSFPDIEGRQLPFLEYVDLSHNPFDSPKNLFFLPKSFPNLKGLSLDGSVKVKYILSLSHTVCVCESSSFFLIFSQIGLARLLLPLLSFFSISPPTQRMLPRSHTSLPPLSLLPPPPPSLSQLSLLSSFFFLLLSSPPTDTVFVPQQIYDFSVRGGDRAGSVGGAYPVKE